MRGLDKQYDIIFFRNSLIYFSSKNRISVINNLAESLFHNGLLFIGVSETSSVKHPLLTSMNSSDIFYFQKTGIPHVHSQTETYTGYAKHDINVNHKYKKHNTEKKITPARSKKEEISVSCSEIAEILKTEDGKPNAQKSLEVLANGNPDSLSGTALTAAAVYFINTQDFNSANIIISHLEKNNSNSFTNFIRGEYYFHSGVFAEAEKYYIESSAKDKYFWPAFYRIAVLAAEGNPVRYGYKIKKTIESIELSQNLEPENERNYECFMGGFSPDYFRRILEKKLL
jgi:chemotaxis protein methyltransferase CheR